MPSTTKLMERSPQDQQQQQQQQQQPLKCPRCDSANTKFCYYNNYSLSQPRHFCKACKRYWTRGGTLRNVPVGGGCRKNKRVKRQGQSEQTPLSANQSPPRSDPAAGYGLTGAPSDVTGLNFPNLRSGFPGMNMENMSMPMSSTGYDLPPQISSLWMNMHYPGNDSEYQTGLHPNHVQGSHAASSLFPDFSLLGSSASSFITSTLQQQQHKLLMGLRGTETSRPSNDFQVFFPMGELDQGGNGSSGNIKGEKMEEESVAVGNKMGNWQVPYDNSMENIGSDSSFYWASNGVGAWQDSSSYGPSSIAPLI